MVRGCCHDRLMSDLLASTQANDQVKDWEAEEMHHVEAAFWRIPCNDHSFQLEQGLYSYDVADSLLQFDEEVEAGVEGTAMDHELEVAENHEELSEVPSPWAPNRKAILTQNRRGLGATVTAPEIAEERLDVPPLKVPYRMAMLTRTRRVLGATVMAHEVSQQDSGILSVMAIVPTCFESEVQWLVFAEACGVELTAVVCFLGMLLWKVSLTISLELDDWPHPA